MISLLLQGDALEENKALVKSMIGDSDENIMEKGYKVLSIAWDTKMGTISVILKL